MKITLCGSTKFKDQYIEWNKRLSLEGHVVYSVAFFGHADDEPLTEDDKILLDDIHKAKIYHSDAIVVINVNNYVGDSTKSEIKFANRIGRPVYYAYDVVPGYPKSWESSRSLLDVLEKWETVLPWNK